MPLTIRRRDQRLTCARIEQCAQRYAIHRDRNHKRAFGWILDRNGGEIAGPRQESASAVMHLVQHQRPMRQVQREIERRQQLEEHRETAVIRGKRTTTIYRWLCAVPLRDSKDALTVNWFSIETLNGNGKRTYHNSYITDLPVTAGTVAELAPCERARWKVENETFNVLKTDVYNLEHNFGHGKETLASILVTLNLLAFAFHTAARLAVHAWRKAVVARGATYRFFEHLRTVTAYVVFETWDHLYQPS
jgi:hypothetical protein